MVDIVGSKKQINSIDLLKFVACFFIITIHTDPIPGIPVASSLLQNDVSRIFLMFFFVVAGYLFFSRLENAAKREKNSVFRAYVMRLFQLYALWTVVYFPSFLLLNRQSLEHFEFTTIWDWLREIVFVGSFYHLWFLTALLVGTFLVYGLYRLTIPSSVAVAISSALYFVGLLGNSYAFLLNNFPALLQLRENYIELFFTTRNGLFTAPLFLSLGWWILERKSLPAIKTCMFGLGTAAILLAGEILWLSKYKTQQELFVMLPVASLFLVCIALQLQIKDLGMCKLLRSYSTLIYLVHPIIILAFRVFSSALQISNSLIRYLIVAVGSLTVSIVTVHLQRCGKFAWLKYFY